MIESTTGGPVVAWLDSSSGVASVFVKQFTGGAWVALGSGAASGNGVSGTIAGVRDLALATDGTKVAVAWTQNGPGIDQVYLREFSGGTWNSLAGSASGNGISNSSRDARAPTLAYSGGSLFAAWQDDSSNYWEIDAVTYNGTSWMPAGPGAAAGGGVSNTKGSATEPRLAASGGKLYLLWADDRIQNLTGNTIALYVKQWNGTAFVEALPGDASGQGVSDTGADPQSLAFTVDGNGHPFTAWSDDAGNGPQINVRGNTYDVGTIYFVNVEVPRGTRSARLPVLTGNSGLSRNQPLPSVQAVLDALHVASGRCDRRRCRHLRGRHHRASGQYRLPHPRRSRPGRHHPWAGRPEQLERSDRARPELWPAASPPRAAADSTLPTTPSPGSRSTAAQQHRSSTTRSLGRPRA